MFVGCVGEIVHDKVIEGVKNQGNPPLVLSLTPPRWKCPYIFANKFHPIVEEKSGIGWVTITGLKSSPHEGLCPQFVAQQVKNNSHLLQGSSEFGIIRPMACAVWGHTIILLPYTIVAEI